jgi:cytochrome c556
MIRERYSRCRLLRTARRPQVSCDKISLAMVGAALGIALATACSAAQPTPGQAVWARQANFKDVGRTYKAIVSEVRANNPDFAVIAGLAAKLNALAAKQSEWFPAGSDENSNRSSEARPEIWSDPVGFAAAVNALRTETGKLQQLAPGGDVDALRAQAHAVGQTCQSCHSKYRDEGWF